MADFPPFLLPFHSPAARMFQSSNGLSRIGNSNMCPARLYRSFSTMPCRRCLEESGVGGK